MADVAATLALWSSTTNSNSPAGTATVGNGVDDNMREVQGVTVRGLSHKGSDIASAATTDLGAVEGLLHDITGTTTITGFGTVRDGIWKIIKFEGALTLTHNSTSLILPGAANITTADGDIAIMFSEGSGNWRCVDYQPTAYTPKRPVLGTEQASTSGTSIDFTSIPSWAKKIIIQLVGVSTNGTSNVIVQLGDSGGVETTGYLGAVTHISSITPSTVNFTAGIGVTAGIDAASVIHGTVTLSLEDASDFTWVGTSLNGYSNSNSSNFGAGSKSLSAALDRVRITTANGTDAFDAGAINILYE